MRIKPRSQVGSTCCSEWRLTFIFIPFVSSFLFSADYAATSERGRKGRPRLSAARVIQRTPLLSPPSLLHLHLFFCLHPSSPLALSLPISFHKSPPPPPICSSCPRSVRCSAFPGVTVRLTHSTGLFPLSSLRLLIHQSFSALSAFR